MVAIGLLLILAGVGLPFLIPSDDDYGYYVYSDPPIEIEETERIVPYQNLSQSEQRIFDTALEQDDEIRRERKVASSHFTYASDDFGYGSGLTPVRYDNQTYVLEGRIIRPDWLFRFWGGAFLVLSGVVLAVVSVLLEFRRG